MLEGRPRARGGVPRAGQTRANRALSSPRTRGCSPNPFRSLLIVSVVPAHAGVFRSTTRSPTRTRSRPRARGGVPRRYSTKAVHFRSSPRTRGCSRTRSPRWNAESVVPAHAGVFPPTPRGVARSTVVPAHAGVFRRAGRRRRGRTGRPRARGGVPLDESGCLAGAGSSPRTRGCSCSLVRPVHISPVVPAHAGVFLCPPR